MQQLVGEIIERDIKNAPCSFVLAAIPPVSNGKYGYYFTNFHRKLELEMKLFYEYFFRRLKYHKYETFYDYCILLTTRHSFMDILYLLRFLFSKILENCYSTESKDRKSNQ